MSLQHRIRRYNPSSNALTSLTDHPERTPSPSVDVPHAILQTSQETEEPAHVSRAPGSGHLGGAFSILPPDSAPPPPLQRHIRMEPVIPDWRSGKPLPLQWQENTAERITAQLGQGNALHSGVRQKLEGGLGADLTGVRVHTDGEADSLSKSVQAVAFTTGADIFFRHGAFNPNTTEGLHLLAHEATHTVQQRQGPVDGTPHPGGVSISDPGDRFERAADRTASVMAQTMQMAAEGRPPMQRMPADRGRRTTWTGQVHVQRRLPDGATYTALDPTDADLVAIGTAVNAYNRIEGTRTTDKGLQRCFNRLGAVDRAIYHWFDTVSQHHQRLSGNPHSATVLTLLGASETEHQALVAASKNRRNVLPFDVTGLMGTDALKDTWQSIVGGTGKIQLLGTTAYKDRVLSELGKIMSTPTGSKMLRFLNTRPGDIVAGSDADALTNIYIGEHVADLPASVRAASPLLKDVDKSEAQPLNIDDSDPTRKVDRLDVTESDLGDADLAEFPAIRRGDTAPAREAAWGGLSGYSHGGKKYTFSDFHTGAFVTSFPGLAIHPGRDPGNEILTASWITMGHELGHAANMRAGAAALGFKTMFDNPLTTGLAGSAAAAKKWDNAEELLNIENVENALRQESRMSEREGHQPPAWAQALAVQTRSNLRAPLMALYNADNEWFHHPDWTTLDRKCRTLPVKDVLDPTKVAALRAEVDAFVLLWRGPMFATWKSLRAAPVVPVALPPAPTKKWWQFWK